MIHRLRPLVYPLSVAVAIAAGMFLWRDLPHPTDVFAPFDSRTTIGESVSGRDLTVKVTAVQIAPRATLPTGFRPQSLEATGVWVVLHAVFEATLVPGLTRVQLLVADSAYDPANQFRGAGILQRTVLAPGIPQPGWLVFDVAPKKLESVSARDIVLRVWTGDERLDSRLVVDIPMQDADITRTDDIVVRPPGRGQR